MKKRLRKKKYRGEFTVWYWTLIFDFRTLVALDRLAEIRKSLFALLDDNNLSYSGGSHPLRGVFWIEADRRYDSVTETQRQLITAWLQEQPEVARVVNRPLVREK